jgi:hypothetical protein
LETVNSTRATTSQLVISGNTFDSNFAYFDTSALYIRTYA